MCYISLTLLIRIADKICNWCIDDMKNHLNQGICKKSKASRSKDSYFWRCLQIFQLISQQFRNISNFLINHSNKWTKKSHFGQAPASRNSINVAHSTMQMHVLIWPDKNIQGIVFVLIVSLELCKSKNISVR